MQAYLTVKAVTQGLTILPVVRFQFLWFNSSSDRQCRVVSEINVCLHRAKHRHTQLLTVVHRLKYNLTVVLIGFCYTISNSPAV